MRKIVFFAVLFILSSAVFGQVKVRNATSEKGTAMSLNRAYQVDIPARSSADVRFLTKSGEQSFWWASYAPTGQQRPLVRVTATPRNGMIMIDDGLLHPKTQGNATQNISGNDNKSSLNTPAPPRKGQWVTLTDSTDWRWEMLDGPFAGIAIKPGQTSRDSVFVAPGKYSCTLIRPVQEDTVKNAPRGREFVQAVWADIIVEGQRRVVLRNGNVTQIQGIVMKLALISRLQYKFQLTAGPWKGALKYGKRTKKEVVNEGFNSITIQFKDQQTGIRMQADAEIIVTKYDRFFELRESDLKNIRPMKTDFR